MKRTEYGVCLFKYPEEDWKSLWNEWKREGKQSQGKQKQERVHGFHPYTFYRKQESNLPKIIQRAVK